MENGLSARPGLQTPGAGLERPASSLTAGRTDPLDKLGALSNVEGHRVGRAPRGTGSATAARARWRTWFSWGFFQVARIDLAFPLQLCHGCLVQPCPARLDEPAVAHLECYPVLNHPHWPENIDNVQNS